MYDKMQWTLTLFLLCFMGAAMAQEVYFQDFEENPVWLSTRPDLVYWEDSGGHFYTRVQDDGTQYYGISPVFPEVADTSFIVEFDVNPVETGWGTYPDLIFKHESEGLERTREDRTNQILWDLQFEVHWDDNNYKKFMLNFYQDGVHFELPRSPTFQENVWYHHHLAYDMDTETLSWTVTESSSGLVFHQGDFVGCRIGAFNQIVAGHQGVLPHYGLGRWCTTLFDNLRVEKTGNQPPVAVDKTKQTTANVPRFVNVAVLDYDPDDNLYYGSVRILQPPTSGTLHELGYGTYIYTPNQDFIGEDLLTYQICDWLGLCDEGQVNLVVTPQ